MAASNCEGINKSHVPDEDYLFRRHSFSSPSCYPRKSDEIVWVRARIDFADPRFLKPVSRYKVLFDHHPLAHPCEVQRHLTGEQTPGKTGAACPVAGEGSKKEDCAASCTPRRRYIMGENDTVDGRWSTLRQMMEFRGNPVREAPPRWGTGQSRPPVLVDKQQKRFPLIRSQNTKFIDEAHIHDAFFRYY